MLALIPGTPPGHVAAIAVVGHGCGADVYQDGVLVEVLDGRPGDPVTGLALRPEPDAVQ